MSVHTILLAHGSSDPAWGNTFEHMTAELTANRDDVSLAFMELSHPLMEDVIKDAAENGQTEFAILPLFLAKGRHLKKDVPGQIEQLEAELGVSISLLPPMGESPKLAAAMIDIVQDALAHHQA